MTTMGARVAALMLAATLADLALVGCAKDNAGTAARPTAAHSPGQSGATSSPSAWRKPRHPRAAAVIGDSTAAGAGLPPLAHPSPADHACGRSADAYAADLNPGGRWRARNYACAGATIETGLLGPQQASGVVLPAQVTEAGRQHRLAAVIVSVGADDLGWSGLVLECALHPHCGGSAAASSFAGRLAAFRAVYPSLLRRLAALPGHPQVVINRYYDPFGPDRSCLGLTSADVTTLTSWLNSLNAVLAAGAGQFGFVSPQPSFAGHQLCSAESDVQWLGSPAPLHPTASGERAIARADLAALARHR